MHWVHYSITGVQNSKNPYLILFFEGSGFHIIVQFNRNKVILKSSKYFINFSNLLLILKKNRCIEIWDIIQGYFTHQFILTRMSKVSKGNYCFWWACILITIPATKTTSSTSASSSEPTSSKTSSTYSKLKSISQISIQFSIPFLYRYTVRMNCLFVSKCKQTTLSIWLYGTWCTLYNTKYKLVFIRVNRNYYMTISDLLCNVIRNVTHFVISLLTTNIKIQLVQLLCCCRVECRIYWSSSLTHTHNAQLSATWTWDMRAHNMSNSIFSKKTFNFNPIRALGLGLRLTATVELRQRWPMLIYVLISGKWMSSWREYLT